MKIQQSNVEILMSTYNGEKFLESQLESIINQTYKNWKLIIRDDGSKDSTKNILEYYIAKYPEKIRLISDNKGNLKPKNSFLELLKHSREDYVMFSDQDDIWYLDKVEKSLKKIKEVEKKATLVHTDLEVVDKDLVTISSSFWKYQGLKPNKVNYKELILKNNITGCTMILNKELVNLCMREFPNGVMHDWIIGIIASLKGEVHFLNEPTIKYRQHGNNSIGASLKSNRNKFYLKIKKIRRFSKDYMLIKNQLLDIVENVEINNKVINSEIIDFLKLEEKFFLKKYFKMLKIILKESI